MTWQTDGNLLYSLDHVFSRLPYAEDFDRQTAEEQLAMEPEGPEHPLILGFSSEDIPCIRKHNVIPIYVICRFTGSKQSAKVHESVLIRLQMMMLVKALTAEILLEEIRCFVP